MCLLSSDMHRVYMQYTSSYRKDNGATHSNKDFVFIALLILPCHNHCVRICCFTDMSQVEWQQRSFFFRHLDCYLREKLKKCVGVRMFKAQMRWWQRRHCRHLSRGCHQCTMNALIQRESAQYHTHTPSYIMLLFAQFSVLCALALACSPALIACYMLYRAPLLSCFTVYCTAAQ